MFDELHKNSVAYAATQMATSMMGSVFGFVYLKVFLDRYHIQESWFHLVQFIYMIWNAVNDPLFGYIQDNSKVHWIRNRRLSILYGAPFWAVAFLLPWFGWGDENSPWLVALHLLCTLCLWDSCFTFILLAQCALFAELSSIHEDRIRLIKYSLCASLVGSTTVTVTMYVSDNLKNYGSFQLMTILIAVGAFLFLFYAGTNVRSKYDTEILEPYSCESKKESVQTSDKGYMTLTWEIIRNENFLIFVFTNFCQILHKTLSSSFMVIIGDALVPKYLIPDYLRSLWFGSVFVLPQITVIFGTPLLKQIGYFKAIRCSYIIKFVGGVVMYSIGYGSQWKKVLLMIFIVTDSAVGKAGFSLFNLPLSDIVDEDKKQNKRSHPISSMVFATNALMTKPAQSIAPMVAVAVLNAYGYEEYKSGKLTSPEELSQLYDAMFALITLSPLILGSIQFLVWSLFQIRNTHEDKGSAI